MASLSDKFDVIKGWEPGGDASIDQSLPPKKTMGVPATLLPGNVVVADVNGDIDVATSPADVTLGTAMPPQVYIVVEGNGADTSAQFMEKVVVLRGKLTVKTDKLTPAQSFPITGKVTYDTGLLSDHGATATTHAIGSVLANNVAVDGTITVELDI
jgi:hypothetical protein